MEYIENYIDKNIKNQNKSKILNNNKIFNIKKNNKIFNRIKKNKFISILLFLFIMFSSINFYLIFNILKIMNDFWTC